MSRTLPAPRHFGTGAEVPTDNSAPVPKCLDAEVSVHHFSEGNTTLNNTQLEYCIYCIHLNVYAGVSVALWYTLPVYRALRVV